MSFRTCWLLKPVCSEGHYLHGPKNAATSSHLKSTMAPQVTLAPVACPDVAAPQSSWGWNICIGMWLHTGTQTDHVQKSKERGMSSRCAMNVSWNTNFTLSGNGLENCHACGGESSLGLIGKGFPLEVGATSRLQHRSLEKRVWVLHYFSDSDQTFPLMRTRLAVLEAETSIDMCRNIRNGKNTCRTKIKTQCSAWNTIRITVGKPTDATFGRLSSQANRFEQARRQRQAYQTG